jgi:hypothetical protein
MHLKREKKGGSKPALILVLCKLLSWFACLKCFMPG